MATRVVTALHKCRARWRYELIVVGVQARALERAQRLSLRRSRIDLDSRRRRVLVGVCSHRALLSRTAGDLGAGDGHSRRARIQDAQCNAATRWPPLLACAATAAPTR